MGQFLTDLTILLPDYPDQLIPPNVSLHAITQTLTAYLDAHALPLLKALISHPPSLWFSHNLLTIKRMAKSADHYLRTQTFQTLLLFHWHIALRCTHIYLLCS